MFWVKLLTPLKKFILLPTVSFCDPCKFVLMPPNLKISSNLQFVRIKLKNTVISKLEIAGNIVMSHGKYECNLNNIDSAWWFCHHMIDRLTSPWMDGPLLSSAHRFHRIWVKSLTSLVMELDGPKPFWPITCFLINYTFIMFLKQYSTRGGNCELSYSGGKEGHFVMVSPNAKTVAGLKRTRVQGNKRKATIQKINNCRFWKKVEIMTSILRP